MTIVGASLKIGWCNALNLPHSQWYKLLNAVVQPRKFCCLLLPHQYTGQQQQKTLDSHCFHWRVTSSVAWLEYGVGTPKDAPKKNAPQQIAPLLNQDSVRLLVCPEDPTYDGLSKQFLSRVDAKGIDFSLDEESASLSIRLRFCSCRTDHNDVRPRNR